MTGKLLPHEQVLSVRKAAKELGVNPNTVQKSYAILEREGIPYSVTERAILWRTTPPASREMKKQEIRDMFIQVTREARDSGLWIDEIFTIVDEAYSTN